MSTETNAKPASLSSTELRDEISTHGTVKEANAAPIDQPSADATQDANTGKLGEEKPKEAANGESDEELEDNEPPPPLSFTSRAPIRFNIDKGHTVRQGTKGSSGQR
ncbi:hypothetical protein HGRIS_012717 [Hohenbuehelia grisea]|uniref:Uncharacterized protein n=1 Tax=Hohenbuehelia grisea TaxID=104357 RepID=A0ABR3ITB1_9AGAR